MLILTFHLKLFTVRKSKSVVLLGFKLLRNGEVTAIKNLIFLKVAVHDLAAQMTLFRKHYDFI